MSIINNYLSVLLSQASYASDLNVFSQGVNLSDRLLLSSGLGGADMSPLQAEYFSENFRVIEQYSNSATGYSATVFERLDSNQLGTGEYHFSQRGSGNIFSGAFWNDWADANLDNGLYGVALNQVVDMVNFYLRLSSSAEVPQFELKSISSITPPDQPHFELLSNSVLPVPRYAVLDQVDNVQGLGDITPSANLHLTGHSLGGHLASAFSLLFPDVTSTLHTFDSAGFVGNRFGEFAQMLEQSMSALGININPSASYLNAIDIRAPYDPVSLLSSDSHLSGHLTDVFIEGSDSLADFSNHQIDKLSDSIAVIHFLHTLDHTLTLETANALLESASVVMNTSLESVLSHIARLFNSATSISITDSDHNDIYQVIDEIVSGSGFTPDQYRIEQVVGDEVDKALAGDKAALYTLLNAQPLVIRGVSADITESLYASESLHINDYSNTFLQDRAEYLSLLLQRNTSGAPLGALPSPGSALFHGYQENIVVDVSNPCLAFSQTRYQYIPVRSIPSSLTPTVCDSAQPGLLVA